MTDLARRFIKTALLFLVLGLLLGAFMLVRRELYGEWPAPYLVSAHTHAVFIGFVLFMILGVALWLFPKPLAEDRRYRPGRIITVYWLLLGGTLVRFGGELGQAFGASMVLTGLTLAGGLAQVAALLLYIWTMWLRIRPTRRQLRGGQDES
ncbi:MAG TPA: hypothetical protein EYP40_11250 [Chromatiales bacterium]|nr:hypothetical protein [Chromatiales bacterium]